MTAQPVKTSLVFPLLSWVSVRAIVVSEGLTGGVAMGVAAVVFAVVGLSPSLSWVPEVPLLAVAVLVPIAAFGIAGFRAGARTSRVLAGALAGGMAGAIGGFVGGVSYVVFGKPALNIAVGLLAGAVSGAAIGTAGALLSRRTARSQPGPGAST
jgi:hypothetical protein